MTHGVRDFLRNKSLKIATCNCAHYVSMSAEIQLQSDGLQRFGVKHSWRKEHHELRREMSFHRRLLSESGPRFDWKSVPRLENSCSHTLSSSERSELEILVFQRRICKNCSLSMHKVGGNIMVVIPVKGDWTGGAGLYLWMRRPQRTFGYSAFLSRAVRVEEAEYRFSEFHL